MCVYVSALNNHIHESFKRNDMPWGDKMHATFFFFQQESRMKTLTLDSCILKCTYFGKQMYFIYVSTCPGLSYLCLINQYMWCVRGQKELFGIIPVYLRASYVYPHFKLTEFILLRQNKFTHVFCVYTGLCSRR